jgi:hypothetical protein
MAIMYKGGVYAMQPIYENKKLKDRQKIDNQERKNKLFKKAKNMMKNDHHMYDEEIVIDKDKENKEFIAQIKQLQKDKNKLNKQLTKHKNEKQIINSEKRNLKKEINHYKEQLYQSKVELGSTINKIELIDAEKNQYKTKYLETISQNEQQNDKIQELQFQLKKVNNELKSKTKQVAIYQSTEHLQMNEDKNQISSLSKKNNQLIEENAHLKDQLKQKDELFEKPNNMLRELKHRMNFFNLGGYWRVIPLKEKYERLQEYSNNRSDEKEQLINKIGNNKYGYLRIENNEYYFHDIEGYQYIITDFGDNPDVKDGSPLCVELVDDKSVKIKAVYEFKKIQHSNITTRITDKNDTNSSDKNYDFEPFHFSVGIVGSREKYYYDFLKNIQDDVSWIDPFEKSDKRLERFINQHEVILFFTDSIPHSFLRLVDDSPKFQMFSLVHSKDIVYNRIRFAALSLGLIQQ